MTYNISNKAKAVSREPMTFMERLYLPGIAKGLKVTLGHIFHKKATINYPEVKRPFSSTFRGLHILNRDEEGREKCTACGKRAPEESYERVAQAFRCKRIAGADAGESISRPATDTPQGC